MAPRAYKGQTRTASDPNVRRPDSACVQFLLGCKGMAIEPLPADQVELAQWSVDSIEQVGPIALSAIRVKSDP